MAKGVHMLVTGDDTTRWSSRFAQEFLVWGGTRLESSRPRTLLDNSEEWAQVLRSKAHRELRLWRHAVLVGVAPLQPVRGVIPAGSVAHTLASE